MKICDKCFKRDGSATMAQDEIIFRSEDVRYDLCMTCLEETRNFVTEAKKRPSRKKEETA